MCIVDEPWHAGIGPSYGEVDEVINEMVSWGIDYYELQRFMGVAFQASKFIPVNDNLDETELVTEEFNEKYCVPVNNPV